MFYIFHCLFKDGAGIGKILVLFIHLPCLIFSGRRGKDEREWGAEDHLIIDVFDKLSYEEAIQW